MTDSPAIFRRATAEDAVAVARLHARSWQATYRGLIPDEIIARVVRGEATRAERFRELFGDPDNERRGWVATHQEAVVGMAISCPSHDPDASDRTGEIEAIYMDPDFTGMGIGRGLFAHVTNDLTEQGFEEATLWVLDSNARARRFYEAAGWHFDGSTKEDERPGGVLHEVRYRRPLSIGT
ncbi:MAG: GNAT family N-acetyltransferase [Chloroflexi bacterium]|nr:GNAT family N-acetyltransferase [Chloroflexota bacterium]